MEKQEGQLQDSLIKTSISVVFHDLLHSSDLPQAGRVLEGKKCDSNKIAKCNMFCSREGCIAEFLREGQSI